MRYGTGANYTQTKGIGTRVGKKKPILQDMPGLFARYVILNTNNLPDGELDPFRFREQRHLLEFLVANSFFLAFRQTCQLT